jgi:hypothetical protein
MNRSTNVVDNLVYYWDPNLGGSGGQGAYVTYTGFDNGGTGSGVPATTNNDFLQPGQAVFVEATSGANGPTNNLIMEYDVADLDSNGLVTGAANTVFSVDSTPEIYIEVWDRPALENGLRVNDATRIRFNGETAEPMGPTKFFNPGESIAIRNGDKHLAIADMQSPSESTLIDLPIYGVSMAEYVLRIKISELSTARAYLEDRMNGDRMELVDGWNIVPFSVDTANERTDLTDRFAISFGEKIDEGVEPAFAKAITLYPNPVMDGQLFLQLPGNIENATVTITNLLGQVVHDSYVANDQSSGNQINVLGVPSGLYHIKINANGVEYSDKIVIK